MDSAEIQEDELREKRNQKITLHLTICRSFLALVFSLLLFLSLSFSILYVAVFIGNLSVWSPISVPSQCRIVSSRLRVSPSEPVQRFSWLQILHRCENVVIVVDGTGVDLRSSKVCELGLFNYKTKHVFYPLERKRYRCHYDYYWASIFKVEYIDHSGQAKVAFAEAPNEALPSNCRPNFGAAWLTKDKLKINGTYECWYTLGISKVDINHEGLFDCQTEDPSTMEMLNRYYILFTRILKSWFFSLGFLRQWRWDVIAGLVTGFIMSLLSIASFGILGSLISLIRRFCVSKMTGTVPSTILLKRACFLLVYFSFMSWISIQYVKRLGLS